MSVRNAVERVEQAVANAPAKPTQAQVAKAVVDRQRDMLAAILPRGADPDRYVGMALQAIKKTPALLGCFATSEGEVSFVVAMNQAAIAGLEPNTPTEDCWILPRKVRFKDGREWRERQEAELQISYKGYIRLAYRSARIASIDAAAVYEADEFEHERALPHDVFRHRESPLPRSERGPITHAYCLVRYINGAHHLTVLDREQVEKRREKSESWLADERRRLRDPSANQWSPWNTWEEEMFLKTAVKAARAFMDLTPEVAEVAASEEQRLGYDPQRQQITHQPFDIPQLTGRELAEARDEEVGLVPEDAGHIDVQESGPGDPGPTEPPSDDGPAPRPPTARQLTKLNILFGEKLDLRGDDRLGWLTETYGRNIRSTKDLTFDEVHDLIEKMEAMADVEGGGQEG